MKVLHLCLCGPYSDKYEYQDNLLPLKHYEQGLDVKVLVSQETWEENGKRGVREPQTYVNDYGYIIQVLPYSKNKKAIPYRIFDGLYEAISVYKPDIIFCHGGLTLSYKDIIRYLKENKDVKFYLDSHIDYDISGINHSRGLRKIKRYCLYRYFWGKCVRTLAKRALVVWGVTPARVEFLKNVFRVPNEKIDLLVMGADENKINISTIPDKRSKLRKRLAIKDSTLLIVTGGKLDKYKNIPQLLTAMYLLRDYDVHLCVFGSASDDMESEINEKLKSLSNVTMLGWADSEEITDYFLGSDIAIFPGRHSVLWEKAVACGLPCVFLKAPGMNHVDVGGNCVFLETDEPNVIAHEIKQLIDQPELVAQMRCVALNKGVKEFSYKHIARKSIGIEDCND